MRLLSLRARHTELALFAGIVVLALALGFVTVRNLWRSAEDVSRLYERLAHGLDLIDELQFGTQEVRRIVLYALHTTDANRQLEYAEQSRAAAARLEALLTAPAVLDGAATREQIESIRAQWREYLKVRDEVIGLILEGSLLDGVALDEQHGDARFNEVRQAIARLQEQFKADAAAQVADARRQVIDATVRLTVLVFSVLVAAAVGLHLVNRRTALERLLRSEAHKGSILEAVPDPIVSVDVRGRILEFNQAAEEAFGVSRGEALGQSFEELVLAPAARETLPALWSRAETQRLETTARRRDGTEFPVGVAVATHTVGDDRIATVHVTDLTERRRVEQELRGAKEAAEVAARAKSDFLATMSHELRTPLTGVIGVADLLQSAPTAQAQRDLVRMLRSSATALTGLVSDILDYSRIEAGLTVLTPTCFALHACIETAIDAVTDAAARKGLELAYVLEPDVPSFVIADEDRVRQVLLNLLGNAVKFTTAGEIVVRVGAQKADDGFDIAIRVRDTGPGIPEYLRPKLFRRFSQLDSTIARHHGGAGLGLAISERLSRVLGGSLDVESPDGDGATFVFLFHADTASAAGEEDPLARSLAGVRVTALVRRGILAEQIEWMLSRWGASATIVDDAADVARLAAEPGDVVLVDADSFTARVREAAVSQALGRGARVVVAAPLRGAGAGGVERVVMKPLRASALFDALAPSPRVEAHGPVADLFRPDSVAILLVEDNDTNRGVVRLMLEELGLGVDEAASGFEAIEKSRQHPYDVIFMDVQMPVLDGLETTRRIRAEQRAHRPTIIALTANVVEGDEARCLDAGMDGYLPKPIRLDMLASVVAPFAERAAGPHLQY